MYDRVDGSATKADESAVGAINRPLRDGRGML